MNTPANMHPLKGLAGNRATDFYSIFANLVLGAIAAPHFHSGEHENNSFAAAPASHEDLAPIHHAMLT